MKSPLKSFLMLTVLLSGHFLANAMEIPAAINEKPSEGKKPLVISTISFGNKDGFVVATCENGAVVLLNFIEDSFQALWLRDCSKQVFLHKVSTSRKRALTASKDNTVRLWDLTKKPVSGIELPGHKSKITSLAVKHDDSCALTACEDGIIRLWDLSKDPVKPIIIESKSKGALKVSFGPNGNIVIDFPNA